MRDRVLAYALAVSVGVHLIILGIVGKTSAERYSVPEQDEMKLVQVEVARLPDEPEPAPPKAPEPEPELERVTVPTPERIPTAPRQRAPQPQPSATQSTPRKQDTANSKLPGDPGGPLDLGSPSPRGQDLGPSGRTPVGWVPGSPDGTGAGSGSGPGVGKPEPVPNAVAGPGTEPAPVPPPPPPPDVQVKVCMESGMLPGPDCERTTTRSFRPGKEPSARCTVCKPKHVSTLADRSVPELVSGSKRPRYPESARNQGIEGSVTIEYTINTEGNVVGVKIVSSSGSSILDRAAVEAVESRKYKPAVQAGIPRNYRKRETFHFTMN